MRNEQKKNSRTAAQKKADTIWERQEKQKQQLLEEIKNNPFVYSAAKKVGVSRATVYRWISEDPVFTINFDAARRLGDTFFGEIAETQLYKQIREGNLTAIIFYLKYRSSRYGGNPEDLNRSSATKAFALRMNLNGADTYNEIRKHVPNFDDII
ncbi:MAG: hypothetical protein ABH880_02235 [Patescibacteria group bacterium]